MSSIEQARNRMMLLKEKSSIEKMLQVTSILTKLLERHQITPIIVGGLAVEIYTRSNYTTLDIDVIVSDRKLAGEILVQLGFCQEGRHWFHPDLLVSIEIPNDLLEDAEQDRVIQLNLGNNDKVFVIGIEDIILDRMRACIHWKSSSDCEWGQRMFLLHLERLDIEYMRKKAKVDLTVDLLQEWLSISL
jgi:hypothetical protein